MPHAGILAQNPDGGALCLVTYCRDGVARLGGHTYPVVTLDYLGFGHHAAAVAAGDLAAVRAALAGSAARLAAAGAEFFVCADNTAHLVLDLPGPDLPLPGLHIAQLVTEAARAAGHRRVGILGTGVLTGSDLYPRWLGAHGIAAQAPAADDAAAVDAIVSGELVDGVVTDASRERLVAVVERLARAGCDAVGLLSTELPMLLTPEVSPLPVLDSARLAAGAALAVAVGDRPLPVWRGGPHPDLVSGGR